MSGAGERESREDVLLGSTDANERVWLRHEDRTSHLVLIGKTGFGKTTLIEQLVLNDMQHGIGAIVIDAHGDLSQRLLCIASPEAVEQLVLVEIGADLPFGLSLYECQSDDSDAVTRTVENVVALFKKLFQDDHGSVFRPVIEDGFRASAYTLIANGYTLTEMDRLFTDPSFRAYALQAVRKEAVLSYWREYGECTPRERRELSRPVLTRVRALLSSDAVRLMVGQATTTIPFDQILDHGGTLLFRLGGGTLGGEQIAFLGMLLLAVLCNRFELRSAQPVSQRRRVHLYIDEYDRFVTSTTERMLAEFRKFEVGITVAQQELKQTSGRLPAAASLVMFQLEGHDAPQIVRHLDTTPRRTKKVMRQRTEPVYLEWTEEVWESTSHERRYEELEAAFTIAYERFHTVSSRLDALTRVVECEDHYDNTLGSVMCDCGYHKARGYPLVTETRQGNSVALEDRHHRLFNPTPSYFCQGPMWEERADGELLTASGYVGCFKLSQTHPGRLAGAEHPGDLYEGYFLRPEATEHVWLVQALRRPPIEAFVQREWLNSMADELVSVLRAGWSTKLFLRSIYRRWWDDRCRWLPPEREGLEHTLDREGMWQVYPWPATHWAATPMPEAALWLQKKIRALQVDYEPARKEFSTCLNAVNQWKKAHKHTVTRRRLIGHKAAQRTVMGTKPAVRFELGRRKQFDQIDIRQENLYDEVEELDQTHADRAAEIATELASLPKYVAYCKILDTEGKPHEFRVRTTGPAEEVRGLEVLAQSRATARQTFGTPGAEVEATIRKRLVMAKKASPPVISRRSPKRNT